MISAVTFGVIRLHVVLLASALGACSAPGSGGLQSLQAAGAAGQAAEGIAGAGPESRTVQLGVPGGDDGLDFISMAQETELRLQTFGQGGTHLLIAVRCTGFGKRAFVSASLKNPQNDAVVVEPAPARPQLLFCSEGEEGPCDLVPYLVHATGLTDTPEQMHGLSAELTARAADEAGTFSETSLRVVLSAADL